MSTYQPGDRTPIQSLKQLEAYFIPERPVSGRMGVEWEQLAVTSSGRLVPFGGRGGVESALQTLAARHAAIRERSHITALTLPRGGMVGLEPGGQVEIATPPERRLDVLHRFLSRLDAELGRAASEQGFSLRPWGLAPMNGEEDFPDVPKARYAILKAHLLATGRRGRLMMKLAASSQFSLDYVDEEDLGTKSRAAIRLLPYLVACTANAPVYRGRSTGWKTRRPWIWRGLDPRRSGLPAFLFSQDGGYRHWVRYGLTRPLLMLVRDGRFVAGNGRDFLSWWREPGPAGPLTMEDWDLHMSTLFPEIRSRGYLEIRTLDSLPLPLLMALAALLKGLLTDGAVARTWGRFIPMPSPPEARAALLEAARAGAAWRPEKGPTPDRAVLRLADAASEGLKGLSEDPAWLEPLRDLARRRVCPADFWRRGPSGGWQGPEGVLSPC